MILKLYADKQTLVKFLNREVGFLIVMATQSFDYHTEISVSSDEFKITLVHDAENFIMLEHKREVV